jgi:hypothetical protein
MSKPSGRWRRSERPPRLDTIIIAEKTDRHRLRWFARSRWHAAQVTQNERCQITSQARRLLTAMDGDAWTQR